MPAKHEKQQQSFQPAGSTKVDQHADSQSVDSKIRPQGAQLAFSGEHAKDCQQCARMWAAHHVQGVAQSTQEPCILSLLCMRGLVQDAVCSKFCSAARQTAVPIQEVQLRLALIVLCIVTVLESRSGMSLIYVDLRSSSAFGHVTVTEVDLCSQSPHQPLMAWWRIADKRQSTYV